jgi:serine/threonine protein phosphatase 1
MLPSKTDRRLLAIGDIHGCYDALVTLFEYAAITPQDQVVFLGDYVDRGPDSARVIEFLMARMRAGDTVCLRGNHEVMMLDARHSLPTRRAWSMVGGDSTWDSYTRPGKPAGLEGVPADHWQFLEQLSPYCETDHAIFVHASLDAELAMPDQVEADLFWGAFDSIGPHYSGKTVICGHSSQKSGLPKSTGFSICIDTWACGHGWLTCLDVRSGHYWQANQAGETRQDWLNND